MPTPEKGETHDKWMQRCMSSEEAQRDFPDQEQRAAFCESRFESNSTLKSNAGSIVDREGVRHALFEGYDHLVVPVVMIVEGVLPGSDGPVLVPSDEFSKFPDSWNGRPVPVLHPEKHGTPVSANSPDVIEANSIGHVFNAYAENGKLKGEAWINTEKAQRLGHNALLAALEAGEVIELSTGYFSDIEPRRGEFNGEQYVGVHRNIRPDHLALLPGEIGACSVADGCGTRVNRRSGIMTKMQDALNTLARGMGMKTNCDCGGESMDTQKLKAHLKTNGVSDATVQKLTANEKLTPEQIEMLMNLDGEQLKMAEAFAQAILEASGPAEEPNEMVEGEYKEEEPGMAAMKRKEKTIDIDALVANQVDEAIRRRDVTSKLSTNEKCPFSESEMKAMSVDHLEKLEKSIRPADYSGQGGFAANSGTTENVQPLTLNRGVIGGKKRKEA